MADAAFRFVVVGVVIPVALDYFNPEISKYVTLPPSYDRWLVLILFGALFAAMGFLQNAYTKGEFPWLFGKIGGGVVAIGFFSYLLLFLPSVPGSQSIEATGLISLIYLAVGLSYVYLIFDFVDARRSKKAARIKSAPKALA